MNVTCPNCTTEFSIPDNVYAPGRKARCSICRHIFQLPDVPGLNLGVTVAAQPATATPRPPSSPSADAATQAPASPSQAGEPAPPDAGELGSGLEENLDSFSQVVVEESDEEAAPAKQQLDFEADMNALLGKDSGAKSDFAKAGRTEKKKTASEKPAKSRKKFIFLLLFLIILGGAGYFAYTTFFSGKSKPVEPGPDVQVSDMTPDVMTRVSNLDLKSGGVKYEYIRNDKLGPILVLQGRVENRFTTPKDYITIEASLLNSKGEVLKAQKQVCGVMLTPLQLSALGQRELIKALNNRIEIMANNVNVLPGQDVPFMVVFVYPPSSAVEIEVRVVDAADPPASGEAPAGSAGAIP